MRANVFQISLGQIDVGEEVKIEINYFQEITTSDTEMRILIPTLVGSRYIPGNVSREKIGPGLILLNWLGYIPAVIQTVR